MNSERQSIVTLSAADGKTREKRRSPWWEVWRRLRRNKIHDEPITDIFIDTVITDRHFVPARSTSIQKKFSAQYSIPYSRIDCRIYGFKDIH